MDRQKKEQLILMTVALFLLIMVPRILFKKGELSGSAVNFNNNQKRS